MNFAKGIMAVNNFDTIYRYLKSLFDEPRCELNFRNNYELLIAVVLSAQCTDKRVNIVTPDLFAKYPTPQALAKANVKDVENLIHSCGFYHNKAKNIINACIDIVSRFNGQVPSKFNELVSLSGVGRKTANVIVSTAFGQAAIAVDTHVLRISNRLGICNSDKPLVCEKQLQKYVPQDKWAEFHYLVVLFGRYHCKAIKPECDKCKLKELCKFYNK